MLFYLNNFEGRADRGYFVKSDGLVKFLQDMKQMGFNPVGIDIPDDPAAKRVEVYMEDTPALREHLAKKVDPEFGDDVISLD